MGYSLCRNSVHDRRNRELGERDLRHLSAIAQDNDPIGVTHQLLQFRRDNQQRQPSAQRVSIRRIISAWAPTSMPRVGSSRIRNCGLVSSQRESSTFCWLPPERNSIGCSALGVRIPSWRIKRSAISFCSRRDRPQPAALRLQGENDIFPHRGSGDNAVGFAIQTEADPEAGSLMRGAQGLRFAFDPRLPAVRRFNAEDHLGGFRASGTQQAGEAYNFARADLQVKRGDGSFLP